MKPDFLIVGAMKAGTTSIVEILNQHPKIHVEKEIGFFNIEKNYKKGKRWYTNKFKDKKISGDKTAAYMTNPTCAKKIYNYNKNIKIIFILRNPIDRTYSNYWHNLKRGAEARDFKECIRYEINSGMRDDYGYIKRSIYHLQIERYLKKFRRRQLYFLIIEEFNNQPKKIIEDLCEFLGAINFKPHLTKRNITKTPRVKWLQRFAYRYIKEGILFEVITYLNQKIGYSKYPDMEESTREELHALFKKHNMMLEKMIGKDLDKYWR